MSEPAVSVSGEQGHVRFGRVGRWAGGRSKAGQESPFISIQTVDQEWLKSQC